MPTTRAQNPRQILEDAAVNLGSFSAIRPETFPDEIPGSDLPVWALDPREEEQEHEPSDTGGAIYENVPLVLIVYLGVGVEPTASSRSSARSSLDTLRDDYLNELFTKEPTGYARKTSRARREVANAESRVLVDAITVTFTQTQDYT